MMTRKMGLYQFLSTFGIVPTYDWAAFGQRLLSWAQRLLLIRFVLTISKVVYEAFKTPAFLAVLVAVLTYCPDTVQWVLLQIGNIQIKCFMLLLSVVMPEIFATGSGAMHSWAAIWQNGLNLLPSDVIDVMNAIGVGELLGLVTSTLTSGYLISIYRKVMLRAGLL